ncbi:C-Myc-binding protein isoform X1 [Ornithorhynchus anatinus]|uniref:C-Myc-binding protein isoform X1 n=1 Tax=Ornithorhynchus anatinus TaxID=9258 RepID=UPI00022406F2|nr:C-Myc-binding protein isoform X1 [Ornithorhynchus anatinus]
MRRGVGAREEKEEEEEGGLSAPLGPPCYGSVQILVALYEEPEKPNSALDFLKHHLGAAVPENPEIESIRLELAEMKEKYEAVLEENKKLKTKLAQYEPPQEEKRAE